MARHVLVAIDESDPAAKALEYALEEHSDATITLLHVLKPDHPYAPSRANAGIEEYEEYVREFHEGGRNGVLRRGLELAADDPDVETALRIGNAATKTVAFADEHGVDLIVIGSHGRTSMSRVLLGSVAETIVRRAPVPVTIVR
ncbi:universal stress protein [Natronolimnohabitans sp. A-GB9]|uniref:universal stress protein n=1 Tax=Natronolimnohabitans sp. A-GB9 TaxID=3069757 RepID=UPI0027B316CC|nr:universal stress protein [Natronolimnohabitans sp. A-GB9]MDQ2049419.1 universal stress protein [Natronolimnohabitans sp. A-GB9]